MAAFVWLFLRLLALVIISCNEISSLQLLIIPEYTLKGLNFSLECKVNNITANINIRKPSGNVVSCFPTNVNFNASCADPAYIINEEAKTVSLAKEASIEDQGEWKCTHTTSPPESASKSITIDILQPLPNGNLTKDTTAEPSKTINTLTGDTFTVFYGCFSSTVKFKWTISSIDWITVGKKSDAMTCPDDTTGYMDTQTVSDIWNNLKTDANELLFVTILTTDDYVIHPASSFDQVFFKSKSSENSKNLSAGKALGSVGMLGCGLALYLLIIL